MSFQAAINPRSERRKIAIDVLGRRFRHTVKVFKKGVPVGGRGQEVMGEQSEAPHLDVIDKHVSNIISLDMSDAGSDGEASKLTQLPPTKLNLPNRVIQIACGLHHSVLLTSSGDVLTFGSNQYGQLGHNDFIIREVPTKIFIKSNIIQIAAGSNHTVLLSSTGQVYTFGNNQKGQLGRNPSNEYGWNAMPGTIPNIGQQFGRRATYITASGDHTFIKYDESLINPLSLSSSRVIANRRCIAIIPSSAEMMASTKDNRYERQFNSLVINRLDGTCKTFSSSDQLELFNFSAVCLDNYYDVLWTYDSKNHSFNRYNLIYSETKIPNQSQSMTAILLPELALPQKASTLIDRSTAALNLLCTLDTLTTAHQLGCTIEEVDQSKNKVCKPLTKDDYSSVCRFESHGGVIR
ncbi:E3 ubiquitin-protein ligase MYCBP2-like [Oppia nitens]|uniref:E3 ubiquitin-protein ligase MYCBP2-like n=1 Tax=Oppia nitens TaxID=1686743 RepID=UPI0023DBEFCD|nr:E3 ubiquitin-protein ligase MYCBP2-like [Oppia nitens]